MRSRIAIFEGYAPPFAGRPSYGGQIMRNPRLSGSSLGRRSYYVPAERGYGPVKKKGGRRPTVRAGYRVKRMRDTPKMKKAQKRFTRAAKSCSRRRNKRKGSFQACMRAQLRKGKR